MSGGPYRPVRDGELRDIFYLTPQSGRTFLLPTPVSVGAFPGSNDPRVTPMLREMLGLYGFNYGQRVRLKARIAQTLSEREVIPIRAHLISLVDRVFEKPWAFPALLDTATCRALYQKFNEVSGAADTIASTAADPIAQRGLDMGVTAILKKVGGMIMATLNWTQYLGGKTKDYYGFYANGISDELALRGIPPSSL